MALHDSKKMLKAGVRDTAQSFRALAALAYAYYSERKKSKGFI